MAKKIRDFVYGSPKFERDLNDAISAGGDEVKIYQHNISIEGTDNDSNSYTVRYVIYSTKSESLFTSVSPTISDVKNVINATCTGSATPYFYAGTQTSDNARTYMYIDLWTDNSLYGRSMDLSAGTSTSGEIIDITSASDFVKEM